jgi:hypothetical protein
MKFGRTKLNAHNKLIYNNIFSLDKDGLGVQFWGLKRFEGCIDATDPKHRGHCITISLWLPYAAPRERLQWASMKALGVFL